jgi:malate synthase
MIINALNSGAKVFMADCEDSMTPTWDNVVQGQINLRDAVARRIEFTSPEGKVYKLNPKIATLIVRPRGWHLYEKHILVDGKQAPGAFIDFGLYIFHNHAELKRQGTGPYFYLPKTESHLEARLWAEVFRHAEARLGLAPQTIKATLLIETILAVFEMHEILYELREHVTGLNCGRWDYIFSFIKKFRSRPEFVLPDRAQLSMTTHFLRSYSRLLIDTCHRRSAYAMGGMAAQIPVKDDPEANAQAFAKVRADKEREVGDGHDGTWVAHPGLVPIAMEVFDRHMPEQNQLHRREAHLSVGAADLLRVPEGAITAAGLENNVSVALQYLASWLDGRGAVPIHGLMEDAATAEIARAQLWQWIRHPGGVLDDGRRITTEMFRRALSRELRKFCDHPTLAEEAATRYRSAAELLGHIVESSDFEEFLTLPAYERLP